MVVINAFYLNVCYLCDQVGVALFDFTTDCFFIVEMIQFHEVVFQLCAVSFILVPIMVNMILSLKILKNCSALGRGM